jgi:hypothetical protein
MGTQVRTRYVERMSNGAKWGRLRNNDIHRMRTKIDTKVPSCTGVALHVSTFPGSPSGESQELNWVNLVLAHILQFGFLFLIVNTPL